MTITNKTILPLCLVLISMLTLTACSTTQSQAYAPGDMTMTDIYHETTGDDTTNNNMNNVSVATVRQQLGVEHLPQPSYASYTRDANNEVSNLFKPLPNPQIPIYIYPHLASVGSDDLPVPGYTTVFSLFSHDEYAMPSEQY